mgnify:FL=1
MQEDMIEIVIGNLIFWPVYMWVCTLPYYALQRAIDNS